MTDSEKVGGFNHKVQSQKTKGSMHALWWSFGILGLMHVLIS